MTAPRLADRVDAGAAAGFQGRAAELERFRQLLRRPDALPRILDIHGPPGIGKSTLLHAFRRLCENESLATMAVVDAAEFQHRLEDLEARLNERLQSWPPAPGGRPVVVAIDTFELMADMEWSFRSRFLEELSGPVLLVVAGRRPLGGLQGSGLGWGSLIERVRLDVLTEAESISYLRGAGVGADEASRIAGFAGGHPLALSIAGELAGGLGVADVDVAGTSNHVIRALVERLATEIKDDHVRALLDAASLVRSFDQELLGSMTGGVAPDAYDAFSRLSVVQPRGARLSLHDSVRRFLAEHLRASRPRRYRDFRLRAFEHLGRAATPLELLSLAEGAVIERAFFDDRPAPEMRSAGRDDFDFIRETARIRVRGIDGAVAEPLLEDLEVFLDLAPERFLVAVDASGARIGFVNTIPLNRATLPSLRERWSFYFDALPGPQLAEYRAEPSGSPAAGVVTGMVMPVAGHESTLPVLLRHAILRPLRETRRMVLITPYPHYKELARRLLFSPIGKPARLFGQAEAHQAFELDLGRGGFEAWIRRLLDLEPSPPAPASTVAARADAADPLTPREREVACLVRDGLTNKEIARRLGISPRTVEVHVANAAGKLGARSRTQLATRLV